MEDEIKNNPSEDSQVAGATTGEQSTDETGDTQAELIGGKFKSQEDLLAAYQSLETELTTKGAKANRGEKYDRMVQAIAAQGSMSPYEAESYLDGLLSQTNQSTASHEATPKADPAVAEVKRRLDWQDAVERSPELKPFRDQIMSIAESGNLTVADAVEKLTPLLNAAKSSAKTKETVKQEASLPSSTASAEELGTLDRQIRDQEALVMKIKSGEVRGSFEDASQKLLRLMEDRRQKAS